MRLTEHYTTEELACRCGCGLGADPHHYDPAAIQFLEVRRRILGRPSIVKSFWRCAEHNQAVGGVSNSAHLRGTALDEATAGGCQRWEAMTASLLAHAVTAGAISEDQALAVFRLLRENPGGIGVAKSFVHVDIDVELPRPSAWCY